MTPEDWASWGPKARGFDLYVDHIVGTTDDDVVAIDVETDEQDGFVGIAITPNGTEVYYMTHLNDAVRYLQNRELIGHNIKADLHFLRKNGLDINPDKVIFDTCLASYVVHPTKDSHGLKTLAKEMLGWEWPSYRDMVGKGRTKQTLDLQGVERVANYCAMDALATWHIKQRQERILTPNHRRIISTLELPTSKVLFQMEKKGVMLDVAYLEELERKFSGEIKIIETELTQALQPTEPGSNQRAA